MDQKEYYYLYYKDAIDLMEDYMIAVKENDIEKLDKIKKEYQEFRENLFENKKYFKGLKRRKFLKAIVKHEDISTTPKYVKSELKNKKRFYFEIIMLIYLFALILATDSIKNKSIPDGVIAFYDMVVVLKFCKEYDIINEELDDVKAFIKEYKYGNNN